jgi:hypothetical protein
MNLVEVFLDLGSEEPTWVPFAQVLPAPKAFRLRTFPKFPVVCETAEDSVLAVDDLHPEVAKPAKVQ